MDATVTRSNYTCMGCNGALDVVLGSTPYWVHANFDDATDCPGIETPTNN